jgi:hypothetical protein
MGIAVLNGTYYVLRRYWHCLVAGPAARGVFDVQVPQPGEVRSVISTQLVFFMLLCRVAVLCSFQVHNEMKVGSRDSTLKS